MKVTSAWFVLPVINLDVLVGLWVVHEPHQLQMKDRREGEELHSFFCFLRYKQTNGLKTSTLHPSSRKVKIRLMATYNGTVGQTKINQTRKLFTSKSL